MDTSGRTPAEPKRIDLGLDEKDKIEELGEVDTLEAVGLVTEDNPSDVHERRISKALDGKLRVPEFESVPMTKAERLQEMLAMMGQAGD